MTSLRTLLGVTAAGASLIKARLAQKFISDFARIVTLAIATGFVTGALLIGGFYIAYQGLVRYGLEPFAAQILIAGFAVIVLFILIQMITLRMRRLSAIPAQIVHTEFPLSSRLNGLADEFLDGLLHPNRP